MRLPLREERCLGSRERRSSEDLELSDDGAVIWRVAALAVALLVLVSIFALAAILALTTPLTATRVVAI